jgi:hypothetical protein
VQLTVFQRYLAPLLLLNLSLTPREATIAISMIVISITLLAGYGHDRQGTGMESSRANNRDRVDSFM